MRLAKLNLQGVDYSIIIILLTMSEQEDGFIGSKLRLIPSSRLIYSTQ